MAVYEALSRGAATAAVGLALLAAPGATDDNWQVLYDAGGFAPGATAWIGEGTHSERTDDGLLIADRSEEGGSGRSYMLGWRADPARGAALEARVRVKSCTAPWGVHLMVADGVHEEGLTLYADRVELENSKAKLPLDTTNRFHTYRIEIKGEELDLFIDGERALEAPAKFAGPAHKGRNRCAFGSGSSAAKGEAVWQEVRYRTGTGGPEPMMLPQVEGLEVEIGEERPIIPDAIYRSLFKFADGTLAVSDRRSSDGGQTWEPAGASLSTGAFEFTDGELIQLGFNSRKLADGVFEVDLSRSTDHGKSFTKEAARLNIPEGTGGTGDDGKHYEGPPVDHAIVQLRDGSLLAAMYGYFKTDTVLCPTFPPEWKLYRYRTWVMRSMDRGRTWDYWATVAYDPSVGLESFCEADLLALPEGDLLAFMRTGGSGGKHTPLYLSRSRDDGKTWSKPEPIADRGVWPNACRMESGVLACTYGRPDNWLCFSPDGGKTWTGHFCFDRSATTSYNTVEEVAPGRLLVVYDRTRLDADGNMRRGVAGRFFTVRRTD